MKQAAPIVVSEEEKTDPDAVTPSAEVPRYHCPTPHLLSVPHSPCMFSRAIHPTAFSPLSPQNCSMRKNSSEQLEARDVVVDVPLQPSPDLELTLFDADGSLLDFMQKCMRCNVAQLRMLQGSKDEQKRVLEWFRVALANAWRSEKCKQAVRDLFAVGMFTINLNYAKLFDPLRADCAKALNKLGEPLQVRLACELYLLHL